MVLNKSDRSLSGSLFYDSQSCRYGGRYPCVAAVSYWARSVVSVVYKYHHKAVSGVSMNKLCFR